MRRLLLALTVAIATSLSDGSAAIPAAPVQPPGLPAAKVTQVVDGDTIKVRLQGREYTLRLIGMDTPETVDPRKSVQCYGPEASNFAKRLLNNKTVHLETDKSQGELDKYARMLRYIWLPDGRMYNYVAVLEGYAREYTYKSAYRYSSDFSSAQSDARTNGRGLWDRSNCNGANSSATQPANATPKRNFDNNNDGKVTCSDFNTQAEANIALAQGYTNLDGNRDGIACESLPAK